MHNTSNRFTYQISGFYSLGNSAVGIKQASGHGGIKITSIILNELKHMLLNVKFIYNNERYSNILYKRNSISKINACHDLCPNLYLAF